MQYRSHDFSFILFTGSPSILQQSAITNCRNSLHLKKNFTGKTAAALLSDTLTKFITTVDTVPYRTEVQEWAGSLMTSYLDAEVGIVGAVAVVPQKSIRLIGLEPDVEFFVPIASVKAVVQLADVITDPRMSVKRQPLITVRQQRNSWRRRCGGHIVHFTLIGWTNIMNRIFH